MHFSIDRDLWEYLAATDKTIVMYGMGNGADKILCACEEKGITVSDFFASDGFVRGQLFHGSRVMSFPRCVKNIPVRPASSCWPLALHAPTCWS